MPQLNAFVTPEYPALFTVEAGPTRPNEEAIPLAPTRVPSGYSELALAVLVRGMPSFLANHLVPHKQLESVIQSLESGNVRVAVVGLPIQVEERGKDGGTTTRPAAFVSVVCSDARRLTVARILGTDEDGSPETLARHVIKEIARGVQIPTLAATEG